MKQLKLVDNLSWLDINKLIGFPEETRKILRGNDFLRDDYIDRLINELKERINDVEKLKSELENK